LSNTVIKVENLSKNYKLGNIGRGTLIADLNQWWAKLRDKEDPYSIVGLHNHRDSENSKEEIWALDDINFEVKQGEVLGIIGKNGAGKSTLLKILSRVTTPTTGSVKVKGRIASLLEVGTGFHPELTGRENIYLNGAILGMTRKDIKNKFDEIIDFSGVERFIDTPVKRYSSGMYVRLAFAVAAHLEPEILIIDEVLAVGDAEFQKKCLGKMKDVSGQGRTVLFVSHNLDAISIICNQGIILQNGKIHSNSTVDICLQNYFNLLKNFNFDENTAKKDRLNRHNGKVVFTKAISIHEDGSENKNWSYKYNERVLFKIECKVIELSEGLTFVMKLKKLLPECLITNIKFNLTPRMLKSGERISFKVIIPSHTIRPGQYDLYFIIGNTDTTTMYDVIDQNIDMPALIILPISDDRFENSGFTSIPYSIEEINIKTE